MSDPTPEDTAPDGDAIEEIQALKREMWRHVLEGRLYHALGSALGLYLALKDPQEDEELLRRSATAGDVDEVEMALAHIVGLLHRDGLSEDGLAIEESALSERIEAAEDIEHSAAELEDEWLQFLASVAASPFLRQLNTWWDLFLRYLANDEDPTVVVELRAATRNVLALTPSTDLEFIWLARALVFIGDRALARGNKPVPEADLGRLRRLPNWAIACALDRRFLPAAIQALDPPPSLSRDARLVREVLDAAPASGRSTLLEYLKRTGQRPAPS